MKAFKNFFTRQYTLPIESKLSKAVHSFSPTERILFFVFCAVFFISGISLLTQVNAELVTPIPVTGGHLIEGVIGTPQLINPLFATKDTERDLTSLVYSGLMKAGPDGILIPDLAESYTISEDGRVYSFILKPELTFHDGTPLTTEDVEFTIKKATDPILKSSKRINWEGVQIERRDDREIVFSLPQPYAPFLENTTIGILPRHIWKTLESEEFAHSQYNVDPIGSGPYRITRIERNDGGIPISYTLNSFKDYALGAPKIKTITLRFYPSEDAVIAAYDRGEIDSFDSLSPQRSVDTEKQLSRIETSPLPRIFGVFFNQNQATVLAQREVRQALEMVVDRQAIIDTVLNGYGIEIKSPIPQGLIDLSPVVATTSTSVVTTFESTSQVASTTAELAMAHLAKNGWKKNDEGLWEKKVGTTTHVIRFALSTTNASELMKTANMLKEQWASIGVPVEVKIFEPGDLNQTVLRPRKYDALLFGEIVGRDLDLFAFWHSSQRNDPGLNIAMYTNSKVDDLLEEARTMQDDEDRKKKFIEFEKEIAKDIPAILLYSPNFLYVLPERVQNFTMGNLTAPSERFATVHEWYVQTANVWKIFVK